MITKVFMGRLGNQMFQYAAVKAFKKRNGLKDETNFDFSKVRAVGAQKKNQGESGHENQLTMFNIPKHEYQVDKKRELSVFQKCLLVVYFVCYKLIKFYAKLIRREDNYILMKKKFEDKIQPFYNRHGLYLYSYGYYDFKNSSAKNKLFVGYFESAKYFDEIKREVLNDFTPKNPPLKKNQTLYDAMARTESVCVSVRRGDFMSSDAKRENYVCTPEYFDRAIELMQKKVKNPRFFFFSDDIEWARKNLKIPHDSYFEDGDDPVWEKLRLMYSCKHFILSNSTFSWWAQYLSRNGKKVVVAPSKWRNFGYMAEDLYDKSWDIIDVGEKE